jgi:hypothetical protein
VSAAAIASRVVETTMAAAHTEGRLGPDQPRIEGRLVFDQPQIEGPSPSIACGELS